MNQFYTDKQVGIFRDAVDGIGDAGFVLVENFLDLHDLPKVEIVVEDELAETEEHTDPNDRYKVDKFKINYDINSGRQADTLFIAAGGVALKPCKNEGDRNVYQTLSFSNKTALEFLWKGIVEQEDWLAAAARFASLPLRRAAYAYKREMMLRTPWRIARGLAEAMPEFRGVTDWEATQVAINRFDKNSHMAKHRDKSRKVGVAAILSFGEGDAYCSYDGSKPFRVAPGSLTVMEMQYVGPGEYLSPAHEITVAEGPRYSEVVSLAPAA